MRLLQWTLQNLKGRRLPRGGWGSIQISEWCNSLLYVAILRQGQDRGGGQSDFVFVVKLATVWRTAESMKLLYLKFAEVVN